MANPNSKWLSERLVSRLSPLRRGNLERRIREHLEDVKDRLPYCEAALEVAPGLSELAVYASIARMRESMLGHLSAMTA